MLAPESLIRESVSPMFRLKQCGAGTIAHNDDKAHIVWLFGWFADSQLSRVWRAITDLIAAEIH